MRSSRTDRLVNLRQFQGTTSPGWRQPGNRGPTAADGLETNRLRHRYCYPASVERGIREKDTPAGVILLRIDGSHAHRRPLLPDHAGKGDLPAGGRLAASRASLARNGCFRFEIPSARTPASSQVGRNRPRESTKSHPCRAGTCVWMARRRPVAGAVPAGVSPNAHRRSADRCNRARWQMPSGTAQASSWLLGRQQAGHLPCVIAPS